MSQFHGSTSGLGVTSGGPLTAIAGFALLINVVGLYAFTGVALCVFGYIALTLFMMSRAGRAAETTASTEGGTAAMVLSWLVALVSGAIVGGFHWIEYAHAAYAVLGVYAVAVLIWLLGRAFSALWSLLFPLTGGAMLAAVMLLGAPPGADDMDKSESWTPVAVTAVDESGKPIQDATVYLDLLQFWQGDPELDGDRKWWSKRETAIDGVASTALQDDPRFKRLLIRVRREPFRGGYNPPTTVGGYVGYEDARLETTLPVAKAPYAFRVVMPQRPHPDTAFLEVELESPGDAENPIPRSINLALTPAGDLPWDENHRTFNEIAVDHNGALYHVYLKATERWVVKLGRDLAARPLTLHVLERDNSRYDDAYVELRTVSIEPIPLGDSRALFRVVVPSGKTTAGLDLPSNSLK